MRSRYGKIMVAKVHPFSGLFLGSRISPYLQEKLVLLGSDHVFNAVPKVVEAVLGIDVNESQVYRVCQSVSTELRDDLLNAPSEALKAVVSEKRDQVYGMIDGSMLPMDDGWQETKVGRVFKANVAEGSTESAMTWDMTASEYVAVRGHYHGFIERFERLLPPGSVCRKVFITDGALWIGNWLVERYPRAVHILDYFHVCEKLALACAGEKDRESWLEAQKSRLLSGCHNKVCKAVKELKSYDAKSKAVLLHYLKSNAYRMRYNRYRQQGLMISSGPIESAHRTVLQVRMKRSGQHWSGDGCDNMIKLRVAQRSNKFELITEIFRKMAA